MTIQQPKRGGEGGGILGEILAKWIWSNNVVYLSDVGRSDGEGKSAESSLSSFHFVYKIFVVVVLSSTNYLQNVINTPDMTVQCMSMDRILDLKKSAIFNDFWKRGDTEYTE